MKPSSTSLYGFTGDNVQPLCSIQLALTIGDFPRTFTIVNYASVFNVVLGQPSLGELRALTSIHHFMVKFQTLEGIRCLEGEQREASECYNRSITTAEKEKRPKQTLMVMASPGTVDELYSRTQDEVKRTSPIEELVENKVGNPDESRCLKVGKNLRPEIK